MQCDFETDQMRKEWKWEAIVSIIVILVFCCILGLSLVWIIKPDFDTTKNDDLILCESKITEVEEYPSIVYSEDIYEAFTLENGKIILITEDFSEYIKNKDISRIKSGDEIWYKVEADLQENQKKFEVDELGWNGKLIYDREEYAQYIMKSRKSGWLLAPIALAGIIFFAIYLYRCIKMLRLLKDNDI
jgi:hypothetical protein